VDQNKKRKILFLGRPNQTDISQKNSYISKAQKGLLVPFSHLSFFTKKENYFFLVNKAELLLIHSFQPSITRQMIMLPLHGQITAAVKNHRAEKTSN